MGRVRSPFYPSPFLVPAADQTMRFRAPVTLLMICVALVGVLCLDWGITVDQNGHDHPWDGWRYGLPGHIALFGLIGDRDLPHYFILIEVSFAGVCTWLRLRNQR